MKPRNSRLLSRKIETLKSQGALNPCPQDVTDPLFRENTFFDPNDMVQVKYEMLRRVQMDKKHVKDAAADCGLSRPSFYTARTAFLQEGLPGLLPKKRGPRKAHKLTDEVLEYLSTVRTEDGSVPRASALLSVLKERFGITAHPRSIERRLLHYIQRQEKKRL